LSDLPDLEKTIAEVGRMFKGENFRVQTLFRDGEQAQEDTEIVIMTAGLEAHINFRIPVQQTVLEEIVNRLKPKEYYGKHHFKRDLMKRGLSPDFADLLISPKPPYNFKTGDPSVVRWARGQHDSLDDSVQHIFAMISGAAVKHKVVYDKLIYNISMSPTMARVLGFEGPAGATAGVLDDVLTDAYKGPELILTNPGSDDVTVSTNQITLQGKTAPQAVVKINGRLAGQAGPTGEFQVQHMLVSDINRLIVEVVSDNRSTRKTIFVMYEIQQDE
jgi:hypothetical protein